MGPISPVFKPSWGIRRRDSILGDTHLAAEWSLQAIPPKDYQDGVKNRDLEAMERLGSQGIATV